MPYSDSFMLKLRFLTKGFITNTSCHLKEKFGVQETLSGSMHMKMSVDEALDYILEVVDDYLEIGGISNDELQDMNILECGPGDTFGVALGLLLRGAGKVDCIDKFTPKRNTDFESSLYKKLMDRLDSDSEHPLSDALSMKGNDIEFNRNKIEYFTGHGIERAEKVLEGKMYDLIISRSVLEYIHDIDQAFASMDSLLKPGGKMIHFIDLRDMGTFSSIDRNVHPLFFLTVNEYLWSLTTSHTIRPNRRRISYYKDTLNRMGLDYNIRIYRVFGSDTKFDEYPEHLEPGKHYSDENLELIKGIYPRLAEQFRNLDETDLLPSGIVIEARKTA